MRKIAFTSLALASSMVFAQENQSAKDSLVISNKKELDSLKLEIQSLKEMVAASSADKKEEEKKTSKWYDKISVGGYVQVRYNEFLENNPNLGCEQCDHFWGNEADGLSFRRLRFKFSGQITPRVFFYIQPDFAKTVGDKKYVGVIKDAYFDLGLNSTNEYRIRIGQSKVPFGYENLQSSSDRLPLDRNDAINSGLKDERDLGVYFLWAREKEKEIMEYLYKKGLKHSGDFGVFALGFYNGQTGNNYDKNKKFHWVARFSYPFKVGNQIIEPGIQAYTGKFVLPKTNERTITHTNKEYLDQRIAASFVLYPQPFGIQAEYNIGKGPEYDAATNSVEVKSLYGGYATFSYFINKWDQKFIPFVRLQHYKGGKKHELDARSYNVKEMEIGLEWHPFKAFELVAMYTISDRAHKDFANPNYHEKGGLIRLQAQLKF